MPLALFDLDHTLLANDSGTLWGEFLIEHNLIDATYYHTNNQKFFRDYSLGQLDLDAYLTFQLGILARYEMDDLQRWREQFVTEKVQPFITDQAKEKLQWHRQRGDVLLIITATNHFVTAPIAKQLGVEHLIATKVEEINGRFTGKSIGIPSFQEGKVQRLMQWINKNNASLTGSWFYSDSHNDLPLLEKVDHPVAVDPDDTLRRIAQEKSWPIISLRPAINA